MTTPTLAQFAKALDAVRAKYPDAPGLPEGYEFLEACTGLDLWYIDDQAAYHHPTPAAALAMLEVIGGGA